MALPTRHTAIAHAAQTAPSAAAAAATAMHEGKLVPDPIVTRLLETRFTHTDCRTNGWLLDGFPRTAAQASALLSTPDTTPRAVVELVVHEADIRDRLCHRRTDPVTNTIYNLKTAPPPDDAHIHARLEARADDAPAVVHERLRAFRTAMAGVREEFNRACVPVLRVSAPRGADAAAVHARVLEALHGLGGDARRVVLAGAPGCGKGTQGALLARATGVVHVSTGDMLRQVAREAVVEPVDRGLSEGVFEQFELAVQTGVEASHRRSALV